MKIRSSAQSLFLLAGDIVVLVFSLWATLVLRYFQLPILTTFIVHLVPFAFIFLIWILVYFIYDLYGEQTTLAQKRLSSSVVQAHIVNTFVSLAFFYFIPYFAITPKTNLFIFLAVSFILMGWWRRSLVPIVARRAEELVVFACEGREAEELIGEFIENPLYHIRVVHGADFSQEAIRGVRGPIVVINTHDVSSASLVDFYNMLFTGARFVTLDSLYETVFGRVPISSISERWFLESLSFQPKPLFAFTKRLMDVAIALPLMLVSLLIYPFIYIAIKLDDGRAVFITPERIGLNNQPIKLYKFRTMTVGNDEGKWGTVKNEVTRVGAFLRATRLDELPQLWNVLKGDLSLIGPRPEFGPAVQKYNEEIKYYNIRHLAKPGLSGWAQIHQTGEPHHGISVNETAVKLSYDLYYLQHRSPVLDLKISLKTIRILLSRSGV